MCSNRERNSTQTFTFIYIRNYRLAVKKSLYLSLSLSYYRQSLFAFQTVVAKLSLGYCFVSKPITLPCLSLSLSLFRYNYLVLFYGAVTITTIQRYSEHARNDEVYKPTDLYVYLFIRLFKSSCIRFVMTETHKIVESRRRKLSRYNEITVDNRFLFVET